MVLYLKDLDYWCRELCAYYPYGLNDNVRGVGNISKQHGLVVHKRPRKFRKRNGHKRRRKVNLNYLSSRLEHCLRDCKSDVFMFNFLPKKSMVALWNIFQCWTSGHEIPDHIVVLIQEESLTYTD